MDYSQFRRSDNVSTENPAANAWDNYWNKLGYQQDPISYGLDRINPVGAYNTIASRFDNSGDPNTQYPSGSLQDQAGANSDYFGNASSYDYSGGQANTPDDTGYSDLNDPGNNTDASGMVTGGYGSGGGDPNEYMGYDAAYAEGGAIPDNDNDNDAGAENDNDSDDVSSALNTIDGVMQHGYKINGLLDSQPQGQDQAPALRRGGAVSKRYDDGGAIPDDDEADPQQTMPTPPPSDGTAADPSGYQGGIPTMDQIRSAAGSIPSPAAPFEQPVRRILNLIQGGGAMPVPQAQQLEHQSGEADPNLAKIKTAATLANTHGPDAAWSYLQSLRKQYDLNRTNAAVKATQGNIPQSTIAATHAMTNVLDGQTVHFRPAQGGVRVTVGKVGGNSAPSKRSDDGGSVDDANGNDAAPAIPEDANGNTAAPANQDTGTPPVVDTVLSIPQYINLLRGKIGQYDQIWNTGITGALKQVASGLMGNGPGPDTANHQFPTPPQPSAALGEGAEGGAPLGVQNEAGQIGTEEEIPNEQKRVVPMPQPRPTQAGPAQTAQTATPPAGASSAAPATQSNQPESPRERLDRLYGKDEVDRAQQQFPAASQSGQMMAFLNQQAAEKQKHLYDMEKTNAIWNQRGQIAANRGATQITVQQMRNELGDRNQAAATSRAISVMAMKLGGQAEQDAARELSAYVAGGQTPPPYLIERSTELVNKLRALDAASNASGNAQTPTGPVQVQTQGNPNASAAQQPRTLLINNKPYYVDASGKVLGPASK